MSVLFLTAVMTLAALANAKPSKHFNFGNLFVFITFIITVSNDNVNSLDLLPTTTEIAAPFDFENFLENLDFNEFNGQHLYDYSDDERSETEVCVLEKCMPSYDLCLIESFSKQNSERDLSTNICIKTLNMCKTQCKAQEFWL